MLQTNSLSLRSLRRDSFASHPKSATSGQRSQESSTHRSLEAFQESLPTDLSANKQAMINRLVALYEQGALS